MLASRAHGVATELSNGVPVPGLSGAANSEKLYQIEVPPGQDQLAISTSGGTGDVDLYVRRGSAPTATSYDYRPFKMGNEESVTVEKPVAGTWFILLRGYFNYSGVTLKAAYTGPAPTTELENGVPIEKLAGAAGSEQYFRIEVPADYTGLEIKMSGGTGDADLYVRKDAAPTETQYDYRPYLTGNLESVTVKDRAAGTWHIMIKGRKAYQGVALVARFSGGVPALENDVPVTGLSDRADGEKIYRIDVPAGQTSLEIKMSGTLGDADLFVKFGARPTTSDYDYRPFLVGSSESVTVTNPAAGAWYIMIRGYSAYSGVTLRATYGQVTALQNGVPVTNLSGDASSERFFKVDVPNGQAQLVFAISGGSGNADMYIRRGGKPTTVTWDQRPMKPDNTESITIQNPPGGTWYVMLKGTTAYRGLTIEARYVAPSTVTVLENNVPVTGIAGAAGQELLYKIEVPAGQEKLEIRMSGGTGDADLYVKRGAAPKTSDYDYRPYLIGNEEAVDVRGPAAGTWFIMIRGYQAFSGITLVAKYSAGTTPEDVTVLKSGIAVAGIEDSAGSERFYRIEVPAGQAKLEIETSGGTGDVDLYVRRGAKPSTNEWDYRPYLIGNNEKVTVDTPQAGTWYVLLKGYTAYKGVTLKATYTPVPEQVTELTNDAPVKGLSGAAASELFFKIVVPADQASLEIVLTGGTGDADLYVRKGAKPTITNYDYRPYVIGNEEKVEVDKPAAATWYVMLRGYVAYTGVTLKATYTRPQDVVKPLQNGVPVKGLAGALGSTTFFSIEVPTGQDFLTIELAGGTGNADLYVRQGDKPMTSTYDRLANQPKNDEKIEITNPAAATWQILVYGRTAYSGVTVTASYGVQARVNDFTSDPHCVALWRFESQTLTKDSIGSNRLENHGVSAQTADVREGAGCADFRVGQKDWVGIDDADLSTDFPTKSGDKDVEMSLCFWTKPRSFTAEGTVISKYQTMSQSRSWQLSLAGPTDGHLKLDLGIGSGNSSKQYDLNAAGQKLARNRWYHVAFTYRDKDRQFHVRVWDAASDKLVYDYTDKATSALAVTRAPLVLGAVGSLAEFYDGLLDEMVVFNDVLTTDEIDLIRQGRYGTTR